VVSPLEAWLGWFEELPPETASELALELMRLWPGGVLRPAVLTEDPSAGFAPRVRRLGSEGGYEAVGTAALIASLTDLVLAERADPSAWSRTDDLLGVLGEASELAGLEGSDLGELVESFSEHARARAPLRQRQWKRAAEAWTAIRSGPLALAALDRARRDLRTPGPPPDDD
jgi:hypothetical protein